MQRIPFLDSHTGGEPTRLVEVGAPDLGTGSIAERLARLRADHDSFRTRVLTEPRGHEVLVGALLVPPADPTCQLGVIFFNYAGYLGMCGHGTIGVVASLSYQNRLTPGTLRIETPVGVVQATLHPLAVGSSYANRVSVRNVPAYRYRAHVPVTIGGRIVHGDIAWGGNWFFLVHDHGLEVEPAHLDELTDFAMQLRDELAQQGIRGDAGQEIDHVELFAPTPDADSRSFVLCPGRAYDRSPCGTGTSAKLACLYADGILREGQLWRQQSVVGSIFEGYVMEREGQILPTITGEAWVMAEGTLLVDERDPFRDGIPVRTAGGGF